MKALSHTKYFTKSSNYFQNKKENNATVMQRIYSNTISYSIL